MKWEQAKAFFESWGLYPTDEDTGDLNDQSTSINRRCFAKMMAEAETRFSKEFKEYCSHMIEAQDGQFYLGVDTWEEMQEDFEADSASELFDYNEDYFRIVWVNNKMFYICDSPEAVKDRLNLVLSEPEVLVLKAEEVYSHGKKV